MLTSLLTYLLQIINTQTKIIFFLLAQLANFYSSSKRPTPTPIDSLDYQKLTVDELPIIVEHETLDYRQLIQDHFQRTGKRLNPVKRRKDACAVPHSLHCPKCQAPHDYLYDNNVVVVNINAKSAERTSTIKIDFRKKLIYDVLTVRSL